jgi:Protein of unknown function (DUF2877)
MPLAMPLQALSIGRMVDVWTPRSGVVHSAFERAVNLLLNGELWTVLGAARMDSPFGIRLAAGDVRFDVQAAERVNVRAGFVGIGRLILDCRTASRWAPTRWAGPAIGLAARLATVERAARRRAWDQSARIAGDVTDALRGSDAELACAVHRTVGLGPGLTPAGDDVLVGILALLTSGAGGAAGDRATSRLVKAIDCVLPRTSDVSRYLLHQAALGLPSRALHDLGRALVEGAPRDVLADALEVALDNGCTSGADACMGLAAACRFTFFDMQGFAA